MVGVLILFAGVDLLDATISPIANLFSKVFPGTGEPITADWVAFLGEHGIEIVLTMVFGFLVNLVIARFTKLKYVFLTGHILFWNAFIIVGALADAGKISGVLLIVLGSIILGFLSSLMPALVAKSVKKLTGSSDFSIGHTTTIHAIIGAWVGKLVGDPSNSLEDVEIKKRLVIPEINDCFDLTHHVPAVPDHGFCCWHRLCRRNLHWRIVWLWFLWIVFKVCCSAGLDCALTGVR